MITITNTVPTIHSDARFDRPRLAALRHASSSAMARYRDVNLVTKCLTQTARVLSCIFLSRDPFRDHSLPEAFRFTRIRPLLAGDEILRTRKPCGFESLPLADLLFADCHAPRGDLLETRAFCGNADTWCTAVVVETVQINCEPGLSIKSNA